MKLVRELISVLVREKRFQNKYFSVQVVENEDKNDRNCIDIHFFSCLVFNHLC